MIAASREVALESILGPHDVVGTLEGNLSSC